MHDGSMKPIDQGYSVKPSQYFKVPALRWSNDLPPSE